MKIANISDYLSKWEVILSMCRQFSKDTVTQKGTYVFNAKEFNELFYPTWNGITASISFVSLTLVDWNVR